MELEIINSEEVGKRYFNYVTGKYYVYNSVFRAEEVDIDYVDIIEDRTVSPKASIAGASSGIVGAIIAGFAGFLIASATTQTKWDVDLDVHLIDGRIIELHVTSERMIKRLSKYLQTVDVRKEKREARGIYGNR
jgi:hypothetical protein